MDTISSTSMDYSFGDEIIQSTTFEFSSTRLSKYFIWIAVILIIVLQVTYSGLTLRNGAFQDEALYIYAGYDYVNYVFDNVPVEESYGLYFSGLPYLYPFFAGLLNEVGGLEAARLLSTVSIAFTTFCIFLISRKLFNDRSALIATAIFAVQGSILFMSRLATYDAMCLALSAIALTITIHSIDKPKRKVWASVLSVGIILLIAVLSKYAALMFLPSIAGIMGWLIFSRSFNISNFISAFIAGVVIVGMVIGGFALILLIDETVYQGVVLTTANRKVLFSDSRMTLLYRTFTESGIVIFLAIIGFIVAPKSWKRTPIYLALLGTMFIPAIYHIYKAESVSFQKHLGYGIMFGSILAGYAVMRIEAYFSAQNIRSSWVLGLCFVIICFVIGTSQAQFFYTEWADGEPVSQELRAMVHSGSGRYLAEENEVLRYYLRDVVKLWQWNHFHWFYYTDKEGTALEGIPAYRAALHEGYFELVILRYGVLSEIVSQVDDVLEEGSNYELINTLPVENAYGNGNVFIWRRIPSVGYTGNADLNAQP